MEIVETEVDKIYNMVKAEGEISSREVADELEYSESYVRKIAHLLQKRNLIDIKNRVVNLLLIHKD